MSGARRDTAYASEPTSRAARVNRGRGHQTLPPLVKIPASFNDVFFEPMPTRTFNLSTELCRFIDRCVGQAEHSNGSEVVAVALKLLQDETPLDPDERLEKAVATAFGPQDESEVMEGEPGKIVAAIRREVDRQLVLHDCLDALIHTAVKTGDYDYPGEAIDDALRHLEARLDREPAPKGRNRRLMKKVAD